MYPCEKCGAEWPSPLAAAYCYDQDLSDERDRGENRTYRGGELSWG